MMDRAREYNTKQNKSEREDKYHLISLICRIQETKQMSKGWGEREKKKERERERNPGNRLLIIENKLIVTREEVGGGLG